VVFDTGQRTTTPAPAKIHANNLSIVD